MISYFFSVRDLYFPRWKDLLKTLTNIDGETGELIREFYTAPLLESKISIAEKIADKTIVVRGFFEWESPPEPLKEK